MLSPAALQEASRQARIGIAIAENTGLNQFLALPNKFFDYIHAGIPQVAMNFPEYQNINEEFKVAILLDEASPERIAEAVNKLLQNDVLYQEMRQNCLRARQVLNWQQEEKMLLDFYQSVFRR
jgi:glycosyltransferase involved in cell wall biosynthesis